jgi:hypothetical protein
MAPHRSAGVDDGSAEGEPPLLAARVAARKRVRDVTAAIVTACALPDGAEELVRSYYQRLEGGLLDPKGVSDRVWRVLEKLLGPAVTAESRESSSRNRLGFTESVVFQRRASADFGSAEAEPASVAEEPIDELRRQVGELFTGRSAAH